jgi:site-specific recombinase XerD
MLEQIYSDERTIQRHRETIFGPHIDAFVEVRGSMQYGVQTLRHDLSHIRRFGAFLRAAGKSGVGQITAEDLHTYVDGYVKRTAAAAGQGLAAGRSVRALLDHLTATNVLDRSPLDVSLKPGDRWAELLKSYLWFLQHHRGLSASTRWSRETWGRALFDYLRNELGDAPLSAITIALVDAFVLERAAAVSRACQHQLVQTVRSLLRYLQQEGHIGSDLARLVAAPRRYVDAALPSGLDSDQAARVLRAVDRGTAIGARDHAILTLLAVYGLRASEVASLHLEDVDWRADQVRVA